MNISPIHFIPVAIDFSFDNDVASLKTFMGNLLLSSPFM